MKQRSLKILASLLALLILGQNSAIADAPNFYPVGPQTNVSQDTISSGNWTLCYSEDLGTPLVKATISNACTGTYILYAGKVSTSSNTLLLAAGERSAVFSVTGLNVTNLNNGTYWYFNDSSLGFAPNATINQTTADTTDTNDPLRFSLHTSNIGGWRIGTINGWNEPDGTNVAPTIWTKQVWMSNGRFKSNSLIQTKPASAILDNHILICASGAYKIGMSDVTINSIKYQLFVNNELTSAVVIDQESNIPDSVKSSTVNKVPALVSSKEALFDLTGISSYSAYCSVEAFGYGASTSSVSNTLQDAALIAANAAKAQAWEDQRAKAAAENFSTAARELRKRIASRPGN